MSPLQAKGKSTLANDEQRAFLEFDFTRYAGMVAKAGGVHQLVLRMTNTSAVLGVTVTIELRRHTARPFTESTVTWNAPGSAGTLIRSPTQQIDPNATINATITFTDAELNAILADGWLRVNVLGPSAVSPIMATIVSREGATVSQRPRLAFQLAR